jgi:hypothetical protein
MLLGLVKLASVPVPFVRLFTTPPPAKVRTVPDKFMFPRIAPPIKLGFTPPTGGTIKLEVDHAVPAEFVTVIGPVLAPTGTVTTSDVVDDVSATTSAGTWVPLNLTILFPAVTSKFRPLITT